MLEVGCAGIHAVPLRLAGYEEITSKIDLGGDYSNEHVKLVPVGEEPAGSDETPAPPAVATKPPVEEHKVVRTTPKPVEHKTMPKVEKPAAPPKPKCQPPNAVDPFSSLPVCTH